MWLEKFINLGVLFHFLSYKTQSQASAGLPKYFTYFTCLVYGNTYGLYSLTVLKTLLVNTRHEQ